MTTPCQRCHGVSRTTGAPPCSDFSYHATSSRRLRKASADWVRSENHQGDVSVASEGSRSGLRNFPIYELLFFTLFQVFAL